MGRSDRSPALSGNAHCDTRILDRAEEASSDSPERRLGDDLWRRATLYENAQNPILQKFSFTGRAQFDYAYVDGGAFDDWATRRLRLGFKAEVWGSITIHSEADLNTGSDPVYVGLTDAYVAWNRSPQFQLKIGKQSAPFTLDGHTSSKELIMLERTNLSNNLWFPQEYVPGASVSGKQGRWSYLAGIYSSGSRSPEFGDFDAGVFGLFSLGYDFSRMWGVDQARLNVDYVFNDADKSKPLFTRELEHVGSVNFLFGREKLGIRADLAVAKGFRGQSDLFGVHLMPFYSLTARLQCVGALTYLNSSAENGVRFSRYESRSLEGRGDRYNEFYSGLNYYIYGHKLKLQTGLKYARMDDIADDGGVYAGWGSTTGIRVSW